MTADRITKTDVERAFVQAFGDRAALPATANHPQSENIGKYGLDHNGVYGGWVVIVYSGGDSGAGWCHGSTPWGPQRRAGRAMFDWLNAVRYGRAEQALADES